MQAAAVIHWVVALRPEAEWVIEAFDLKYVESESALFPVYESESGEDRLVLSGVGKVNAAAATAVLAAGLSEGTACGWVNIGIAGCSELRYGEAVIASKVTDPQSQQSWFPAATWPKRHDLPRLPLITVDQPMTDHASLEGLVDMEAAGFYPIALKASSVELVHVVKVVSDDPSNPVESITKQGVVELFREAMPQIIEWAAAFRKIVEMDAARLEAPESVGAWLEVGTFSATQTHQLRRHLQEIEALTGGPFLPPQAFANEGANEREKGKATLRFLREHLKTLRSEA